MIKNELWKKITPKKQKGKITTFKKRKPADSQLLSKIKNLSKKEPLWAEPINKIATIKFLMGDYLGSVNDIQLTLQLEPRHFGAISGLVQINMFFKNYSEALKNLDYVILINPFINIQKIRPDILKLIKKSSIWHFYF